VSVIEISTPAAFAMGMRITAHQHVTLFTDTPRFFVWH
jgi:hypothetical protein